MSIRTRIVLTAMALGVVAVPLVSEAAVYVQVAPPAPRVEVVPASRAGYVWAPGYWNWNGRRHAWVGGSWVRERRGYHYAPHAWVQRGDRWQMNRGHWER